VTRWCDAACLDASRESGAQGMAASYVSTYDQYAA